jgi:hypothetical protein
MVVYQHKGLFLATLEASADPIIHPVCLKHWHFFPKLLQLKTSFPYETCHFGILGIHPFLDKTMSHEWMV